MARCELKGKRGVAFYKSKDLKNWERTGKIDDFYECPEVLNLPVDGDANNRRWVMFAADAKYIVGQFDGDNFQPEHAGKRQFIYGPVYAGQCFSNPPDGRAVYIGWARVDMGDSPFSQGFTLPLNLTLHETPDGIRMRAYPIEELDQLHDGELFAVEDATLTGEENTISFETDEKIADIHVVVRQAKDAKTISLTFSGGTVLYDVTSGCVRGTGKAKARQGQAAKHGEAVTLRVLIDRPMYESFLNHGESYTLQRRDAQPLGKISLETEGTVEQFRIHKMKSIWK